MSPYFVKVDSVDEAKSYTYCASLSYALTEGIGFGKASISVAFRGMKTSLPQNLLGWGTGTLEIGDVAVDLNDEDRGLIPPGGSKLTVKTTDSTAVIPKKAAEVHGSEIYWDLENVRLPVYTRYASSVVFELGSHGGVANLLKKAGPDAIAVLWLQDLTDDVEQEVKLPIFVGDDLTNLRQNAINDFTAKHHTFRCVGWLRTVVQLHSGLDQNHEALAEELPQARRHALEA